MLNPETQFSIGFLARLFLRIPTTFALLFLSGSAVFAQAPVITQSPAPPTIFLGDPVTFQVSATGDAPLAYQWYRNDIPQPGATSSSFTIPTVAATDHEAWFSVRITNTFGAVTSAPVMLTVDFGVPGNAVTNRVLNFNSTWRYNLSNNLNAVSWTAPAYNDSFWPIGPGLLAAENNSAITPLIGTALLAPNTPPPGLAQGHAYYFRTTVNVPDNNLIPGLLVATIRADDGAVIYVNGTETLRVRMPAGPVSNTTFATAFPPGENTDATVDEVFQLDLITLPVGPNVIAASVHQANATSSDLVWGMALDIIGYQRLRDTVAPTVVNLVPPANAIVPGMNSLEVAFSESVKGVQASDLLIDGAPATNVIEVASDVYVFEFPPRPIGPVQISWAENHDIIDRSANSNLFNGGTYSFTVNPATAGMDVRITEFMAGNSKTIRDNDGDYSDWIELHNASENSVNIGNWYLTDNIGNLTKWRFPVGLTLPPDGYLIVWASDKDRRDVAAPLHTNFKLSKNAGNFLGLVYSDGLTVMSAFTNYPAQYDDISYGRDRVESHLVGYFNDPTPGSINSTAGAGLTAPVQFSRTSGTFQTPFQLTLSSPDPQTVIRYFLVTNATSAALTNVPNSSSPVYTQPIQISSSVQVRARAFSTQPNVFPSEPRSETFVHISAGAAGFTSDLPIILLHNFSGNTPPSSIDQSAVMMVFDTQFGRAALTNPPAVTSRIGLNIRGSSTEGLPKKSFAVETWDEFNDDANVSILGMPAESDWVLYAPNFYDKSWIHNPLMHNLSRSIGRYSPRAEMVEVFTSFSGSTVNYSGPTVGHYNGLYVLMEKIKRDSERVAIERLDPHHTNAPAITGGYLLKIDRNDPDERTFGAANQSMVFVEPQMKDFNLYPGRALQQNYIATYFNSFYSALTGPNWTNPITGYAAWIDVDAWVDHHLLNVLSLSSDALRLSAYLYKDREQKIAMGPLWDFDRALGTSAGGDWRAWNPRSWMSSNPLGDPFGGDYGTDYFNPAGVFANPWYSRLLKDPDFWQKWIDRYQTLRSAEFSTNAIFAIIDSLTNNLGAVQVREILRWSDSQPRNGLVQPPAGWPDRSYSYNFPGTYAGEVAFQKKWLADRLEFIDTNFLARPTLNHTGGLVSAGQTVTLTPAAKANSRLLYTLNGTDPRLPGGAIAPGVFSNLGPVTITVTTNVRVFARSWNPTHQNLTGSRNPPISSPWSGPITASIYTGIPPLRITEVMYHPSEPPTGSVYVEDDFEFIELQNIGNTPLQLQGAQLSGAIEFTFPALVLASGQHVVVAKNIAAFQSRYGSGTLIAGTFTNNLPNSSGRIILHGPFGEPIHDFTYSDAWYPATDGAGFSLVIKNALGAIDAWNSKAGWRSSSAINGSPGATDPAPTDIAPIVVNETLTHTDPPLLDTVELYNPTTNPVNIGGWFLTDNPQSPQKYRIPDNTLIAPDGFITFDSPQFGSGPTGFAFSSTGESVYLFSGDAQSNLTGYAHGYDFGPAPNSVSFGRYVNSQGREFFVLQSSNTLGQRNAYPRIGPVIVSEIMYQPPAANGDADDVINEFIELLNITSTNVPLYDVDYPLNTWRLRDAVDFEFPPGVVLGPGGRALVVGFDPEMYPATRTAFVTRYNVPAQVPIFGPWRGNLNNSKATVELERPDKPNISPTETVVPYYVVEKIAYESKAPWPAVAAGTGASLQRIEATLFANDPLNWQAATPTAGQSNPGGPAVDVDNDGLPDVWELAHGLDPQVSSGSHGATGDLDQDGASNEHEFIAGTRADDPTDYLRFSQVQMLTDRCELTFPTQPGRIYRVEWTDTLGSTANWSNLAGPMVGTGETFSILDPLTGTRYYRLRVSLQQ